MSHEEEDCDNDSDMYAENTILGHILNSNRPGESEAEMIAQRIEKRRANRVHVTLRARITFLHECSRISRMNDYGKAEITFEDLQDYRDEVEQQVKALDPFFRTMTDALGIRLDRVCLLRLLNHAIANMDTHLFDQNWFHYTEFSYFHTLVQSRWPWWRTPMRKALLITFFYYLLTPILFCTIMDNKSICESVDERWYRGWVSSLYFASTTVSTVGYGDLFLEQEPRVLSFVGVVYMIGSVVVSIIAVSAAAGAVFVPFQGWIHQALVFYMGKEDPNEFLYKKISRLRLLKTAEITIQFLALNLLGVFADRIDVFINGADVPWMTSFYWAIQTTTTIGYGDTVTRQSFGMRWFKIIYLILATYSVGNALGRLRDLSDELSRLQREHAWQRSKVTKRYIEETQVNKQDDKVDQYEFLVASMLTLGKVNSSDVRQIMDKFRELAGDKGYISIERDTQQNNNDPDEEIPDEDVAQNEE